MLTNIDVVYLRAQNMIMMMMIPKLLLLKLDIILCCLAIGPHEKKYFFSSENVSFDYRRRRLIRKWMKAEILWRNNAKIVDLSEKRRKMSFMQETNYRIIHNCQEISINQSRIFFKFGAKSNNSRLKNCQLLSFQSFVSIISFFE